MRSFLHHLRPASENQALLPGAATDVAGPEAENRQSSQFGWESESERKILSHLPNLLGDWVVSLDDQMRVVLAPTQSNVSDEGQSPPQPTLQKALRAALGACDEHQLECILDAVQDHQALAEFRVDAAEQADQRADDVHVATFVSGSPCFTADGQFDGYVLWGRVLHSSPSTLIEDDEPENLRQELQLLREAFEAVPYGIIVHDHEDRLILCNARYKSDHGVTGQIFRRGLTFADGLRRYVRAAGIRQAIGREEDWLRERIAAHRNPDEPLELADHAGRIYRVEERRTRSGGTVGLRVDISDLREAQSKLEAANARLTTSVNVDYLTGIANRRHLIKWLENLAVTVVADDRRVAIFYCDINNFKIINDTYGHVAGDHVLKEVARRLTLCAPDEGIVARLGGDEFVVIDAESCADDAGKCARRFVDFVSGVVEYQDNRIEVQIAMGVAVVDLSACDVDEGIRQADVALAQAKRHDRGRVELFTPGLQQAIVAENKLRQDIRRAIDAEEFFCVYQPRFNAETLRVEAAEALVRWRLPDGNIRGPGDFVDMAAKMNVLSEIDRLVLKMAIRDQEMWGGVRAERPRLSVNVSQARLEDGQLFEDLAAQDLSQCRLAIELVETTWFDGLPDSTRAQLRRINNLGVQIEVDDFGAGHASITGLLGLDAQVVKIDRRLVMGIDTDRKSRKLLNSILLMLKGLDFDVVAEGIETAGQYHICRALGCDQLQGFGLARPMANEQFLVFLRAGGEADLAAAHRADLSVAPQ